MLDNLYKLKITKNEIALYQMIEESDNFSYSLTEIANKINLTRQTVIKSLNTLVRNKLVRKVDFFIGRVRRCKYNIVSNSLHGQNNENGQEGNILHSQNLFASQENGEIGTREGVLGHKKTSLKHHFKTRYLNNNKINNSNQSKDTPFDLSCQEGIANFFEKVRTSISKIKTENSINQRIQDLLKRFFAEKNDDAKKVVSFFEREKEEDKQELLMSVAHSFATRCLDKAKAKIRNVYGYLRKSIVNAVNAFYENRAIVLDSEEVVLATTGAIKMAKITKNSIQNCGSRITYKNFEHRDYTDEDFEKFYCTI